MVHVGFPFQIRFYDILSLYASFQSKYYLYKYQQLTINFFFYSFGIIYT